MLGNFRPKTNCEEEAKFLQDRIQYTEKHLADLCDVFGQYARKTARVRDKGDEIAKAIQNFSSGETINKSLSIGLDNFADSVSTLSDFGDARTRALETKGELSRYEDVCKRAKEEVKDVFMAREREAQRKKQLDRIRDRNPRNRQQIMQAETELVKATAELSKTVHDIEDKTSHFERQKLHDVKGILLDFIAVEMGFHAKALEVLSEAFKLVENIDEDLDLEDFQKAQGQLDVEFKKTLRLPHSSPAHKTTIFNSAQSLGSIFSSRKSQASKSKETLDSMKQFSASEPSEASSESDDEEESEEEATEDDNIKPSRRKLK